MQMPIRTHIFPMLSIVLLFLLAFTTSQGFARQYTITGKTMGTFYSVKFISMEKQSPDIWQQRVDVRLKEVNARLSMYTPTSELSRFNHTPANQPFKLSTDFYQVLLESQHLYQITTGAWDGTVKPLVDLWGFGTKNRSDTLPDPRQIQEAHAKTGFHKLTLANHLLTKKKANITLDLGSIAKGYGVDAIATSGNYRNFFERDGQLFSHIIDPKTGFPVGNKVVSTSVIAENCTIADGLATALMVMEVQKGIDLVNSLANTECLIIQKQGNGFISTQSDRFEAFEKK